MELIYRKWQEVLRNNDGTIAIVGALVLTGLLVIVALTTDLGSVFFEKRRLQAATDAAAMAAAQDPVNARTIATGVLTANGFANAQILSLTTGTYTQDMSVPMANRYTPNATPANAVALTTTVAAPLYFARVITSQQTLSPTVNAVGLETNEAGLVAGSGLASLNGGLANAILGSMLGANVSLSANSYQGLLNTNISALSFMNAMATQLNVTAGTYGQLMTANASMQQVLSAEMSALSQQGQFSSTQLSAMQGLQSLSTAISGTPTVNLASLIDAGAWQNALVNSVAQPTAVQANLNLYQLNSFAAQIANGSNFLAVNNATSVPGVATVNVAMTEIEPQQGSYYAIGPVGLTVHTSQVRLLLTLNLLSGLQIGLTSAPVSLQVYVEVAYGTAGTTAIACGSTPSSDTIVTVAAQSGVANEYVGSVTPAVMTNFTQPVTVNKATLVNLLGLATVNGSAQIPTLQGNLTNLFFNETEIQAQTPQTVTSTDMLSNFGDGLATNLQLTGTVLGIPVVQTSGTATALDALLQPAFAALDGVVDSTLGTLGVHVGYLNVTVTGARCGVPALIK